jgi:hypothetical protein
MGRSFGCRLKHGKWIRRIARPGKKKERRERRPGTSVVQKSAGVVCRWAALRREISRRPVDGYGRDQREMREGPEGYL